MQENAWLQISIKEHGILHPMAVSQLDDQRYIIIDGHRRYMVAQLLALSTIPCIIYSKLKPTDLEIVRFELENNHLKWTGAELSTFAKRLKILLRS